MKFSISLKNESFNINGLLLNNIAKINFGSDFQAPP